MSSLTPAQRQQFLEKARRKKEQPEKKVDVLSQLDVGEDKKKMKCDSRVSLQVKPSSSSSAAGEKAAKTEGEVKSPVKKKLRGLSRKNKKDQEMVDVDKDLVEVDDHVTEVSPAIEEAIAGATKLEGLHLGILSLILRCFIQDGGYGGEFCSLQHNGV
jgi:hypothetical protein